MEKDSTSRQAEELYTRYTEAQDNVMEKMKELNIVKCENLPLKTESASLRALLDEEKER